RRPRREHRTRIHRRIVRRASRRVAGAAVHRRGDRRLGQEHANHAALPGAALRRPSRRVQRVGLLADRSRAGPPGAAKPDAPTAFSDRVEREIIPSLKAGGIVLADRYVFTAFGRDVVRGVNSRWVRSLYRFAPVPAQAFYFRVPLEVALRRILSGRPKLKHYEAGLDLLLHTDPAESYKLFQSRILIEYETMVQEFGLHVMDATLPVEVQQRQLRAEIRKHLPKLRRSKKAARA